MNEEKSSLRKRMTLLRECMPLAEREGASLFIFNDLFGLKEFQNAEMIYAFAGYGSEVSTLDFVFKMMKKGKRIALPRIMDKERIEFFEVRKISDLVKNERGIPEPSGSYEPVTTKPDLVLVPGTAFDKEFYRLGYGRGYYDRFLSSDLVEEGVPKIGLAFSCQIVDRVPRDEWDVPVDMIITENGMIR